MNRGGLWVLAALLAVCGFPAQAAIPPDLINYQGVLRDSNNKPLTGTYDMVFRFYDAETGGNELLIDRHLASGTGAVVVAGGLFNTRLGSGEVLDGSAAGSYLSLSDAFQAFANVYLEVEVAGEILAPRTRVVSAAYAMNSGSGSYASGIAASVAPPVNSTPVPQQVTGVGFRPTRIRITILGNWNNVLVDSIGTATSPAQQQAVYNSTAQTGSVQGAVAYFAICHDCFITGTLSSFDADGFTLQWQFGNAGTTASVAFLWEAYK